MTIGKFDPLIPGVPVSHITNPGRRGITTGNFRRSGTRIYVEIEVELHNRIYIEMDELELIVTGGSPGRLILSKSFGKIGDLARILTFHKISSDLSNVFYSMQASRTDFYAYQFKPVYKFIESVNNRLLITDEVGLGKTIEAGLIWTELKARTDASRLLIICPSMLLEKWRKELRDRFSIDAHIYNSQALKELIDTFLVEGDNFHCNAICSLQTVRQDSIRNLLDKLDEKQHKFDLVIVDEAHHLRNIGTQSHSVVKKLSDLTNSMVLLTATPIHLMSDDLFRLLSILDSDEFAQKDIFEYRLLQNAPVIRAQNAIRSHPVNIQTALNEIRSIQHLSWFERNPIVKLLIERLENIEPDDIPAIVEVGRLIENINLFGSIISRTRKREVQEWRVIRKPVVYAVDLNDQEKEFYKKVTTAVVNAVSARKDNKSLQFSLIMPQRQMASSIPAMVKYYQEHNDRSEHLDVDLLIESGLSDAEDLPPEEATSQLTSSIRDIVNEWDEHNEDTKFSKLKDVINEQIQRDRQTKIVVFSYFKKTLDYLQKQLAEKNIESTVIHGDIAMDERLERISIFRESKYVNVLLSSEVGSEGIDLQFSNVLINYDLPWNPMKIEQRIGRLDRLGQKSEAITIINFAVKGTIEEKILTRLYDRIDIFRHCLGDLEPILGRLIQDLTCSLLSLPLSAEEMEARIDQTQRALVEKRQLENDLVEESTIFFGSSDYILEQIGKARKLGRWITPEDLKSFVTDFFNNIYQDVTLHWDSPQNGLLSIKLSNQGRNDLHMFCRNQTPVLITQLTQQGRQEVVVAYTNEAAQSNKSLEMLTHFHPLVQWIIYRHKNNPYAFVPTSAVKVNTNTVEEGLYLIAIEFWEFSGLRREVQIASAISPVRDNQLPLRQSADELVQEILKCGIDWERAGDQVEDEELETGLRKVQNILSTNLEVAYENYCVKNEATFERQRTNLISYKDRKKEEWERRIYTLRSKPGSPGQVKGFESALQKHLLECQEREIVLKEKSRAAREFKEVAVILCKVINH